MENTDLSRELSMAGTSNQINKMTEDPINKIPPEAGVRAAEVAAVPSGPSVIVKSASQSVPDMTVDCLPEWTVLDLKQFLSNEHSLKPALKEQRLIYSGHLMKDDSLLTSLLKHSSSAEGRFVLHLVCAPSRVNKSNGFPSFAAQAASSDNPNTSSNNNNNSSSSNSIGSALASDSSGLRHRTSASTSEGWVQPGLGGAEVPAVDFRAQAEAYKQYYESYMRSYMAYLQSVGVAVNPSDASVMAAWRQQLLALPEQMPPVVAAPGAFAADVTDRPQQQQPPQPREAQPAQQPQMNVDELQIVDEDAVPHDWLDSLYILVRFGVLVCFVYFYSSFYRFFIIITVGVLLYLYRVGWFRTIAQPGEEARPRDAGQQQAQDPPAQRPPPPTPAQPNAGSASERSNSGNDGASSSAASSNDSGAAASSDHVDGAPSVSGISPPSEASSHSLAPTAAVKPEAAASSRTDSPAPGREASGGEASTAHTEQAGSLSEERATQGGSNSERSTPANNDISADSAANDGTTPPPPAVSLLTLSWTFITAFLTSLVPDHQQVL